MFFIYLLFYTIVEMYIDYRRLMLTFFVILFYYMSMKDIILFGVP